MEIKEDLPIPAYYSLCDDLEDRINRLQYLEQVLDIDESDKLRNELVNIKKILEKDSKEKIKKDIERLHKVVIKRIDNF